VISYIIHGEEKFNNIIKDLDITEFEYGLLVGIASNLINLFFVLIGVS
jgi:hypothetical protein